MYHNEKQMDESCRKMICSTLAPLEANHKSVNVKYLGRHILPSLFLISFDFTHTRMKT